ncbi:transglutaminase N-terminal domain-containing protein [Bradyrhizobium erythrophlei]|uniref:transglutaminase N-terminal domain-containing protein n=1 Tax=Bradyrhizobium erythrophlei TaxID=1437360 RepID=UPI003CC7D8E4
MNAEHEHHRHVSIAVESYVVASLDFHGLCLIAIGAGNKTAKGSKFLYLGGEKKFPVVEAELECSRRRAHMTIFTVNYTTIYRYQNPVRPGRHQLLFRPRDSFDQRLISYRLAVSPEAAETRWIHDAFGNCLTLFDFDSKTTLLRFETEIRVDHTPEKSPDFRIEDYARTHPSNTTWKSYPIFSPTYVVTTQMQLSTHGWTNL